MNYTFKNNIHKTIQTTISLSISLITVACALLLSIEVFELTKGRNYSDVGIAMYTQSGRAFLLSILTYVSTVVFVFLTVRLTWIWNWFMYIYCVVNFFALILVLFPLLLIFGQIPTLDE